jgi:hypothetical protein
MPDPSLNSAAKNENARSLAAALGIEVEQAGEVLNASVLVTAEAENPYAGLLANQLCDLLRRTVSLVSTNLFGAPAAAIEVILGSAIARSSARKLWVGADAERAWIERSQPVSLTISSLHPALSLVVACYAAGAVVVMATNDTLASVYPKPLVLDLLSLGRQEQLEGTVQLEHAYMAGAGAIGNGVLYALQYFDVQGQLDVVDFDIVKDGNLNRQVWFEDADIGKPKAEVLVERARERFPHLVLVPRLMPQQDLPEKLSDDRWLKRLIVAVDSRRARRSLQSELPREVFDASTTDIREVILHHNKQPSRSACMACIYAPDAAEDSRTKHVAEALGVSVQDVQENVISQSAAKKIAERFRERAIMEEEITGEAYDSLFKSLCGQAALHTSEGREVFAPFAFVSVLAGTLLVLDLVRRLKGEHRPFNFWRVSPWFPFTARLQRDIEAASDCQVCAQPQMRSLIDQLWNSSE